MEEKGEGRKGLMNLGRTLLIGCAGILAEPIMWYVAWFLHQTRDRMWRVFNVEKINEAAYVFLAGLALATYSWSLSKKWCKNLSTIETFYVSLPMESRSLYAMLCYLLFSPDNSLYNCCHFSGFLIHWWHKNVSSQYGRKADKFCMKGSTQDWDDTLCQFAL